MHVESLVKPCDSISVLKALPGNWISKDIHLVYPCLLYLQVMKVGEFSGQKVQDVKKVVQKQMIDKVI